MPKFNDDTDIGSFQGNYFGFSAVKNIEDLGASEYTLATVVVDRSGSTARFQRLMENAIEAIAQACRLNDDIADKVMFRVLSFDSSVQELHGFKFVYDVNDGDYDNVLRPGGMTALFDACIDSIDATAEYGRLLQERDYTVNGIVFVITDGMENHSRLTGPDGDDDPKFVKDAINNAIKKECLDSIKTVLIAINTDDADDDDKAALEKFNTDAEFTEYIDMKDAKPETIARLINFVSQNISDTSQLVGTGGPSMSITF
jgi:hypothetical protein